MIKTAKQVIYLLAIVGLYVLFLLRLNEAFGFRTPQYDPGEQLKLTYSKEIVQHIEPQAVKLYGIAVRFSTYWNNNEGRVCVRLYEDGSVIREAFCDASELANDNYCDFVFNKPVKTRQDADYAISVECDSPNEWNTLCTYLSNGGSGLFEGGSAIDDRTLCFQLLLVNDGLKVQAAVLFGILAVIMLALVLFKFSLVPDISYGRLIAGIFLAALVVEMFTTDLLHDIKYEVDIAKYTVSDDRHTIGPGETWATSYDDKYDDFTRFLFFVEGDQTSDIKVKIVNQSTGTKYFDRKIKENEIQYDDNTGKIAVVLSVFASDVSDGLFTKGIYDIEITNTDIARKLDISIIKDPDGNEIINAELVKVSWIGHCIALIVLPIIIIYLILMFICVRREDFTPERFYLVSAVPMALAFLILMLPWSQPDTGSHFNAIYRLSNMVMGSGQDNAWQIRSDDLAFYKDIWSNAGHNPDVQDYLLTADSNRIRISDPTPVTWPDPEVKMEYYSIVGYLPQVLGFVLGRSLGLGTIPVIYLGRIAIMLAYIIACYHAIKITPVGKTVFALTALLPMPLMMSSALSYDAMVLISAFMFTASVLRLYNEADKPGRHLVRSMIWAFVIGGVKGGGYLILLPLVFILCSKDIKKTLKLILPVIASGVISVVFFDVILPAGSTLFQFGGDPGVLSSSFAREHPVKFIDMCIKTYLRYIDNFMINMGGTKLAWLDEVIPNAVIAGLMLLTGLYAIFETDELRLKGKDKWIMAFILLVMFTMTPVMLLSFNGIGAERIDGIQGRYYLPALPLIYMILTKYKLKYVTADIDREKTYVLRHTCFRLFAMLLCISVYYMMRLYLTR